MTGWWAADGRAPVPALPVGGRARTDCAPIAPVSVARGNVVLADCGRSVAEAGWQVPTVAVQEPCRDGCPDPPTATPGRFRPTLAGAPLTFAAPVVRRACRRRPRPGPAGGPPAAGAEQRTARPATPPTGGRAPTSCAPGRDDRHVVVEVDDDGIGHLRFGDDVLGRAPAAGEVFSPSYRIGNGPQPATSAPTAIVHVVQPAAMDGGALVVRNPLSAAGGVASRTRRAGEGAGTRMRSATSGSARSPPRTTPSWPCGSFRRESSGPPRELRWTGSWYEMRVAVDALGTAVAPPDLLAAVAQRLEQYRRIGHDLVVVPAVSVGLYLELHGLHRAAPPSFGRPDGDAHRIGNRRSADGRLGMFHPDAVTFGAQISVSAVVATAAAVAGVDNVTVNRLERYGVPDRTAVESGVLVLGGDEVPRLDDDPSAPQNGLLKLVANGGL